MPVKAPVVEAFAVSIEIVGVVEEPSELIGEVPETPVTVPPANPETALSTYVLFAASVPLVTVSTPVI